VTLAEARGLFLKAYIYWIFGVIGIIILIQVMMIIWYGFWLNKKFSRNQGEEQAMVQFPVRVAIPPIFI